MSVSKIFVTGLDSWYWNTRGFPILSLSLSASFQLGSFMLCWFPYACTSIVEAMGYRPQTLLSFCVWAIPGLLTKTSVCTDPIIYFWLNPQVGVTSINKRNQSITFLNSYLILLNFLPWKVRIQEVSGNCKFKLVPIFMSWIIYLIFIPVKVSNCFPRSLFSVPRWTSENIPQKRNRENWKSCGCFWNFINKPLCHKKVGSFNNSFFPFFFFLSYFDCKL